MFTHMPEQRDSLRPLQSQSMVDLVCPRVPLRTSNRDTFLGLSTCPPNEFDLKHVQCSRRHEIWTGRCSLSTERVPAGRRYFGFGCRLEDRRLSTDQIGQWLCEKAGHVLAASVCILKLKKLCSSGCTRTGYDCEKLRVLVQPWDQCVRQRGRRRSV